MITGCSDSELRVWKINSGTDSDTEEPRKNSEKQDGKRSAREAELDEEPEEKTTEVQVNQFWKIKWSLSVANYTVIMLHTAKCSVNW